MKLRGKFIFSAELNPSSESYTNIWLMSVPRKFTFGEIAAIFGTQRIQINNLFLLVFGQSNLIFHSLIDTLATASAIPHVLQFLQV